MLDTTIGKQTQHNMCWAPLSANKHKQHVLDTTIGKQTNKQTNKHKQRKYRQQTIPLTKEEKEERQTTDNTIDKRRERRNTDNRQYQ